MITNMYEYIASRSRVDSIAFIMVHQPVAEIRTQPWLIGFHVNFTLSPSCQDGDAKGSVVGVFLFKADFQVGIKKKNAVMS